MGRRYRKTRRGKRLILKLSVFFLIVCVGAILHIKYNVHPVIRTISEETARAMMNEAVNEAAALVMEGGDSYADIIDMQKNDAGDIVLISADPVAVNDLARSIALLAQTKILQSGEQGFDVPWGTLSGITFLSGKGGGVHFRAIPVGSASTHFASTFRSMGINQTLHRIFLNIDAQLSVVIPGVDVTVNTETEVLLAESVIVGKVPDTYLQSDKLDEMLNLVP